MRWCVRPVARVGAGTVSGFECVQTVVHLEVRWEVRLAGGSPGVGRGGSQAVLGVSGRH